MDDSIHIQRDAGMAAIPRDRRVCVVCACSIVPGDRYVIAAAGHATRFVHRSCYTQYLRQQSEAGQPLPERAR